MRVWRWPLREALVAYQWKARRDAIDQHRFDCLMYALIAPWSDPKRPPEKPKLPPILREIVRGPTG